MANYKLNSKDKITYIQYTIQSSLSQHCYTLLTVKSKSPINRILNVPSMISTRQTSAHDNNIVTAIKCLRAVPGTPLNSTQLAA